MTTPLPSEGGLWDQITIDDVTFTGKVSVRGIGVKKKLDKKRAPGADGTRITDKGFDLVDFSITLEGWTSEHMEQLDAVLEAAVPRGRATAQRNAVGVVYPSLQRMGIREIYVEEAGILSFDEKGSFTQELKVVEYRPPTSQNVTHAPRPAPETPLDPEVQRAFTANQIPRPSTTSTGP